MKFSEKFKKNKGEAAVPETAQDSGKKKHKPDPKKLVGTISKKHIKNGSYSMAMAAVFIVIVVVINMIVGAIPSKYSQLDVSSSKLYTIGDETKKVLKALDKDVTIYQIAASGSEDDTISNLLSRYKDESKHIKVEVKDQQCSVEVHLHCPGLPENVMCRIYGFTRKDGLINGILLDSCETEKEIIECLIITDALNMNESGIALGKMGGMVIITDNGGFFGTEWDDQIIRPENFRELKAESSSDVSASPIDKTSHTSDSPDSSSDIPVNDTSRTSDTSANKISYTSDTPIDENSHNMADINSDNIDTSFNVSAPANISDSSFKKSQYHPKFLKYIKNHRIHSQKPQDL